MSRHSLETLLDQADSNFPPQQATTGLVARVRARAAWQARARLALAAIGSILIATAVLQFASWRPTIASKNRPERTVAHTNSWRAELAELDATAELHQKTAEDLMAIEQRDNSEARIDAELQPVADPLSYLEEARDRAARVMLMDADRLRTQPGGDRGAEEIVRRAERLFPDTTAIREATSRPKRTGQLTERAAIHA